MAQCSEDELYQRADNLVRHAGQHFQSLFLQRWEGLTQSKWSGKKSVQLLADMLGVHLSRLLLPHQKSLLVQGLVEEWDITLLSRLLIHFNREENDEADQAIRSITDVRNKLAHNARKKLNFEDYSSTEREVKKSLVILGMEETAVQSIIDQAEAKSMNSVLEQFKKIQTEGDSLFNKKNYEKAIQVYSDAMLLPNLPPGHLSVLYAKRGYCHMAKSKKSTQLKKSQLDLAFSDGEKAIELNSNSWEGHHILALIYQGRGKPDDALVHYRRAIAISPGQSQVKSEMDACTIMEGRLASRDYSDPRHMPMTLSEKIKQHNEATNSNISEDTFLNIWKHGNGLIPGEEHVNTGNLHAWGWGVPQSYSEAAKHYEMARKVGSPGGIFCLAVLHKEGFGVKRNIPYAIELYLEAANKPIEVDKNFPNLKNEGVLQAQLALGKLYQDGVGVPKDFCQAAYWYKKAADNGCGASANNLAAFYLNGQGVLIDEKMAEMYLKTGVAGKSMNSAYGLYTYYFNKMEPQLAKAYFNISIELGNERLKTSIAEVFRKIDEMAKDRAKVEDDIKAFEAANKLSTRGLTFSERMKRKETSGSPEMAKLAKELIKVGVAHNPAPQISAGLASDIIDFDEIALKSEEGSETAENLFNCLQNMMLFMKSWDKGPSRNPVETEKLISSLYLFLTTTTPHLQLPSDRHPSILQFVTKLFKTVGGERSKLDMQLRFCVYQLQCRFGGVDAQQTELLAEAVRRYPDEIPLYIALTNAYMTLKDFRKGLEVAIKGLLKEPNDPNLLYAKAVHIRLLVESRRNGDKEREAYKQFLENAPKDHRKVPEAYYCLGASYLIDLHMKKTMKKGWEKLLCHYYRLGEEAEKLQLSCYLPIMSSSKLLIEKSMMTMKIKNPSKGRTENNENAVKASGISAGSAFEEKMYFLEDPRRIRMIKVHREVARSMKKLLGEDNPPIFLASKPNLHHKIPKSLTELKAIVLQEMNPTKDRIYEGKILNLTIIDEPNFGLAAIHLIAEDDNGEPTRLYIYDVEQNEEARKTFGFGAKLAVINPYMTIAPDHTNGIRVDDPKCLIHNEGVKDMCRYCGKEEAKSTCSKCKKAQYCGKECQEMDWKVLKHKLICFGGEGK